MNGRVLVSPGMRKERGNYRNPQMRRVTRLSSAERRSGSGLLSSPVAGPLSASSPLELTPEQLIGRMMEAEPPEIYLMKDMKRPLTEANVMMSLTNLADKELVHMISWAKKIPGTLLQASHAAGSKKSFMFSIKCRETQIGWKLHMTVFYIWNCPAQL